jgi:DNA-binding Lrp family transcriptional regulator
MKRKADSSQVVTIDKKDEAIIHYLEQDPNVLLREIPAKLKASGGLTEEIPYPTLQRRMKRLIKDEVVSRNYTVNWNHAGYLVRYRVGILIEPTELRNKMIEGKQYHSQEELADYIMFELSQLAPFKNKLVIDDVFILLGGNVDLAIDFYAKDDKTATQFIIDTLRSLPGISNTVSAKLAYSSKHKWLSRNGHDEEDKPDVEQGKESDEPGAQSSQAE